MADHVKRRRMKFNVAHVALRAGRKDVTRRTGWGDVVPGEIIEAYRQTAKGDVELGTIRVVALSRERLLDVTPEECAREGYPRMKPREFVDLVCRLCRCTPDKIVNRIEFVFTPHGTQCFESGAVICSPQPQ